MMNWCWKCRRASSGAPSKSSRHRRPIDRSPAIASGTVRCELSKPHSAQRSGSLTFRRYRNHGCGRRARTRLPHPWDPYFFFVPIAGVLADRMNRQALMVGADVIRAALCFGFFVVGPGTVWVLFVLQAGLSIFTVSRALSSG